MPFRLAALLSATLAAADPAAAVPDPAPAPTPATFTLQRIVPRGEARAIAFYASLFPDCTARGPVVVRVLVPPRHGRVTVEEAKSFPQYGAGSPLAECNTRRVPGKRMTYEGEAGYEGTDSFRVLVINADGTGYESDVQIALR